MTRSWGEPPLPHAGRHLLVDLYDAERLDDPAYAEKVLRDCAEAGGATVLGAHVHEFEPTRGVSGVVVLAESHISIHTWPEHGYAALDLFLCGEADPYRALPVLEEAFRPGRVEVSAHVRGTGLTGS